MQTVSLIFPNQLFKNTEWLSLDHKIFLIEETLFFNHYNFHKQKLIYHRCSMQFYYGYLKEIAGPNWVQAVNNTLGKVITYSGGYTQSSVIQAFYSSSTGGKTNDNVVGFGSATPWPYLKTVDDPWSVDNLSLIHI